MVLFAALRNIRKNNISSKKMKEGFYMEELISKEALRIAVLDTNWNDDTDEDVALDMIDDAPTVEAKKAVHARWIFMDGYDAHKNPIYLCTNCQKTVADYYINKHNFCLHCGAIMDGRKPSVWNGQYGCPNCGRLFGNKIDIDSDLKFKEQTKKCSCGQHLVWDFRESEQNKQTS